MGCHSVVPLLVARLARALRLHHLLCTLSGLKVLHPLHLLSLRRARWIAAHHVNIWPGMHRTSAGAGRCSSVSFSCTPQREFPGTGGAPPSVTLTTPPSPHPTHVGAGQGGKLSQAHSTGAPLKRRLWGTAALWRGVTSPACLATRPLWRSPYLLYHLHHATVGSSTRSKIPPSTRGLLPRQQ